MKRYMFAAILFAACTSSSNQGQMQPAGSGSNLGSSSSSSKDAPRFLAFGTDVSSLTANQSVIFSAVLTDPDGINDVIGGDLTSADGKITYGSFATTENEGAYSLTLSWGEIQQTQDISFKQNEMRQFVASFYDAEGNNVQQQVTIELTCNGGFACQGACASGAATDCGVKALALQSCSQVCSAANMSCDSTQTNPGVASFYDGESIALTSCSTVPTANYQNEAGIPFESVDCTCIPSN